MDNYILDDAGNPVVCDDILQWSKWYEANAAKRVVAKDTIGAARVSTVFLSLDHQFGEGPPVLWETMIFGGSGDIEDYQERYTSLADAKAGHAKACQLVREALAALDKDDPDAR